MSEKVNGGNEVSNGSGKNLENWNESVPILDLTGPPVKVTHLDTSARHKLGQLKATAICGNDIMSSCLYVSALSAIYAGPYAPIALLIVGGVLYLYRKVYAEVGSALPLNGGAYNVLLNTTTKAKASMAACLTLLSYVATAVISANEAMHYAHNLWQGIDVFWATIVLLGLFALLNIIGITESAMVAVVIFVVHILTLIVLVIFSAIVTMGDFSILIDNWGQQPPHGMYYAIFFGFSAAMLGISGFESSANFIEEQRPGVFPKTLRNMWIAIFVFNPLISFFSLALLPLNEIANNKEALLAEMGLISAGPWLQQWVSFDAVLVLSGAVLTSYVGVTGLVRRMSLDRCLPQFLLHENKWRQTNHWIVGLFFVLACSILVITKGKIESLATVYTISFLSVMALFAIGNMMLKVRRSRLPRSTKASWLQVSVALIAVLIALAGNFILKQSEAQVFAAYFAVTALAVAIMFLRIQILQLGLFISRTLLEKIQSFNISVNEWVILKINDIQSLKVVFFTRGDNMANLNRAALYVMQNEQTDHLVVVHVYEDDDKYLQQAKQQLDIIDRIYPGLRIDFVGVKGKFGPELIERLSNKMKVPKNYMFIGTPGDRFPHSIGELGGVRLII
jgi:amino acid transporter